MLTDEQRNILIAMQCITVPEGDTISVDHCHQVWEWADYVLKAHRKLRGKVMCFRSNKQESNKQESIEKDYRQLTDVLAGRAAIHVVNGEVCICPLNELPRHRVELFQKALAAITEPGLID